MRKPTQRWLVIVAILAMLLVAVTPLVAAEPSDEGETAVVHPVDEEIRFRARDLGVEIERYYRPGEYDAITDVPGVLVGQKTVWEDPPDISHRVRSGVTAILTDVDNMFEEKAPCAIYLSNAFGKLAGYTQVKELGSLETPILLTGTLNVPKVADALMEYMLFEVPGNEGVGSINPVVGETNDGYLNDLRARPVDKDDVYEALEDADTGPVLEGSVGAGTGTHCLGWKGGIGTASRVVGDYTIGVLVQTNFGGDLKINGAPVGRAFRTLYRPYVSEAAQTVGEAMGMEAESEESDDGSCMVIVATDAPLDSRNLERLAKRAMYGLVACGSYSSNGSGDYMIAFSTAYTMPPEEPIPLLPNWYMSRLFRATKEAAEEAVLNSMFMATTVVGRDDHQTTAIPIADTIRICENYDVLFTNSKIYPFAPKTKEGTIEDGAVRLEQLLGYVSDADIPDDVKSPLVAQINEAIEKNSEALDYVQEGDEQKANKALRKCSDKIEAFKKKVEADEAIQEPYAAMFVSRANLQIWICDKAIALPIE